MKKFPFLIVFLLILGVAFWNLFQNRSRYGTTDEKECMTEADNDSEVNFNVYDDLDKLAAYDLAADLVKRSLK